MRNGQGEQLSYNVSEPAERLWYSHWQAGMHQGFGHGPVMTGRVIRVQPALSESFKVTVSATPVPLSDTSPSES